MKGSHGALVPCWWRCEWDSFLGKLAVSMKLNAHIPCDLMTPLVGTHQTEMSTSFSTKAVFWNLQRSFTLKVKTENNSTIHPQRDG